MTTPINPLFSTTEHSANPLRVGVSSMFASRDSLDEAMTYAIEIANASNNSAAVVTAIMVVINTAADIVDPLFSGAPTIVDVVEPLFSGTPEA
jgi:hypothetical protein